MFFIFSIFSLIGGVALISFGQYFVRTVIEKDPKRKYQGFPNLRFIRIMQCVGLVLLIIGLGVFHRDIWPWHTLMGKKENIFALLEHGSLTKGQTVSVYYQRRAPEGWRLDYEFLAEDACSHDAKTYVGSAQGPKHYYKNLSTGTPVTIIYLPMKPEVNCEIRYFLNNPVYRQMFERAEKSTLLTRFNQEYDVEDYSFKEWFRLQHQK